MRTHDTSRRVLLVPVLGLAFAAAVTACSSSSSSSAATATTSAPASTSPSATASASSSASSLASEATTGSAAIAAAKANWVAFFDGTTPTATRISLLENGSQYASILKTVLGSPTGKEAGATVQTLTLTSATGASVAYTITISGAPVLGGQKGTEVYQDGVWKVSTTSFCGLAALENNNKAVAGCPTS